MKFIRELENFNDGDRISQKALFEHEGSFYHYSYSVWPEREVDETMVFACDSTGTIANYTDLWGCPHNGYVPTSQAMRELSELLALRKAAHS